MLDNKFVRQKTFYHHSNSKFRVTAAVNSQYGFVLEGSFTFSLWRVKLLLVHHFVVYCTTGSVNCNLCSFVHEPNIVSKVLFKLALQ